MPPVEASTAVSAENPRARSRWRNFLSYARSVVFTNNLIYLYTALCGAASLAGSLFDSEGRWQHGCARAWSRLILWTSRIRVRMDGLENFEANSVVIFCSNHPSAMDIPILLASLPVQFRFLAKRSLFHLPFLGWHLRRSGHIPVERGSPREAARGFEQAAQRIREGRPVVMFPEGSRNRAPGMLPFKNGSFYLAILSAVPIVPITINGSREVLKPDSLHVRPGRVQVTVHKPISTEGLSAANVAELSRKVHEAILAVFRPATD